MAEVGFKRPYSFVGTYDPIRNMRMRSGRTYAGARRASAASRIQRTFRRYRQTRTVRRPVTIGGSGVTSEHDRTTLYRKLRTRKNPRWQNFKKKVHKVSESELGSRTVVFSKRDKEFKNQVAGEQCLAWSSLYSLESQLQEVNNDLKRLGILENAGDPTALAGATINRNSKYIFKSGVLDITIRNLCQKVVGYSGSNPVVEDAEVTLETDVYEIVVGKGGYDTVNGRVYHSVADFFRIGDGDTPGIGGSGNQIELKKRGVTPFDIPYALSDFKIKILKKTKYFIRPGNTITYQFRDPKRRVTTALRMTEDPGCNKAGWTKHILIVAKSTPGEKVGPFEQTEFPPNQNINNVNERILIGSTRKYLYKIEGQPETRDQYVTDT